MSDFVGAFLTHVNIANNVSDNNFTKLYEAEDNPMLITHVAAQGDGLLENRAITVQIFIQPTGSSNRRIIGTFVALRDKSIGMARGGGEFTTPFILRKGHTLYARTRGVHMTGSDAVNKACDISVFGTPLTRTAYERRL